MRKLLRRLALNYHYYRCACKPSEHCYFKGKYKAYLEVVMNDYGVRPVIENYSDNVYKVSTPAGNFYFEFGE